MTAGVYQHVCLVILFITASAVNYGISNITVLEIP